MKFSTANPYYTGSKESSKFKVLHCVLLYYKHDKKSIESNDGIIGVYLKSCAFWRRNHGFWTWMKLYSSYFLQVQFKHLKIFIALIIFRSLFSKMSSNIKIYYCVLIIQYLLVANTVLQYLKPCFKITVKAQKRRKISFRIHILVFMELKNHDWYRLLHIPFQLIVVVH